MADILLINAPSPYPGSKITHRIQGFAPLGLGYIGACLKKEGFTIDFLDFYIDDVTIENLNSILIKNRPKIIGISTATETFNNGIKVAEFCKRIDEKIVVVMGGPHVTFEYDSALKSGFVDIVARQEGEITFVDVAKYFIREEGSLENIEGINYISGCKMIKNRNRPFITNLDSLPLPDRDLLKFKNYSMPGTIVTSRGCPGKCIFCAAGALAGGQYRVRSAESVVEEMQYLKSEGIEYIHVVDDTMTADIDRLSEIIHLMRRKKLKVNWGCESRVDIITPNLLRDLKGSGCVSLQYGVETGSQTMLDSLKKGITMEQIRNAFRWTKESGIRTFCCFVIGTPFDTKESINDSFRFAEELLDLDSRVTFTVCTPFPGTYMYNCREKLGLEIVDYNLDNYNTYLPVYNTKHLTQEEIRTLYYDGFCKVASSLKNDIIINENKQISNMVKKAMGR